MQCTACDEFAKRTMVSVVVTGHEMSGKTCLALSLAGFSQRDNSIYHETCTTQYLKADVDGRPWHIWDTPAFNKHDWPAFDVLDEASAIVVCHDGRSEHDPFDLIRSFDVNKCIIAHTKHANAGCNLSWMHQYFNTVTSEGLLVPIVPAYNEVNRLISAILKKVKPAIRAETDYVFG